MQKLTLVFPLALIAFIILVFAEYLPVLKKGPALPPCSKKMTRTDRFFILGISVLYAFTAFVNLGNTSSPESFCRFSDRGEYALIELQKPCDINALVYFSGLYSGDYYLQFSPDGETWTDQQSMSQKFSEIFKWHEATLGENTQNVKYIRIISGSKLWLGEVAIYTNDGLLSPKKMSYPASCAALFDEQDTIPNGSNYMNSSYFDEVYHARTAYEHVANQSPYEISHPPLGKLIIGIGIELFGLTPFGWRFMGTLFGVLMLPALYLFLKRLFGGAAVPAVVTAVFATDFMHFAQTRIATIDTYSVFFIILMYLFMWCYLESDREKLSSWLPPLALSGLFFGLGAASKWTCLYAGAGLGLIWLIDRIRRRKTAPRRETICNILWCLLFFVLAPAVIYYLSYYPYGTARGLSGVKMFFSGEYLKIVLDNQQYMFSYHSGVDATHPYSSRWWQWVLNIRPILYYLEYFDGGTKSTMGAFLNPLLCWAGIPAMLSMVYLSIFRRDRKAQFILIGYLAQLLPWVFVTRITFAYHYFPSSIFLLLALGHVFDTLRRGSPEWKRTLFSFAAVSLVLFIMFYPVLSGAEVSSQYTANFLRWLPKTWPF